MVKSNQNVVYISGAMTGYTPEGIERIFGYYEKMWSEAGFLALNLSKVIDQHSIPSWNECMAIDIPILTSVRPTVALIREPNFPEIFPEYIQHDCFMAMNVITGDSLPSWKSSSGTVVEQLISLSMGLQIVDAGDVLRRVAINDEVAKDLRDKVDHPAIVNKIISYMHGR